MFVDSALVRRVERTAADDAAALGKALAALEPGLGSIAVPLAGGQLVLHGPGMFVNRGLGMGMETPVTTEDLEYLERLCEGVAVATEVEVCPWADRSVLDLASARGFRPAWFRSTLLRRIERGGAVTSTEGVTFEQVKDDIALATWRQVAATGFGYSTVAQRRASDLYAFAAFSVPGERFFVASIANLPVGMAALVSGGYEV